MPREDVSLHPGVHSDFPHPDVSIGELDLDIETLNKLPDVPAWSANCPIDCTQDTACNCDYWSSVGTYVMSCCCC